MIIGITGTYRSGKGTVSEYLISKKNFKHFSMSDYIIEVLEKRGFHQIDRKAMIDEGNRIREELGADFIVKELFKRAKIEGGDIIIESIRNPAEASFIKSQKEGYLIAVDAHPRIRYDRAIAEGGIKDNVTFEEFIESERKEFSSTDPNAQNLKKCVEMADFKIDNNSTKEELENHVREIVYEIERGGKERKS